MASYRKQGRGYQIRCSCGVDANGKRINKNKTWIPPEGMTERQIMKELQKEMVAFEEACTKGLVLDTNMTFGEYVNKVWLAKVEKEVKLTTFRRYTTLIKRILPAFERLKMNQIQPFHIRSFIDDLRESKREDAKCLPTEEARRLAKSEIRPELAKNIGISTTTLDYIRARKSISKATAEKFCEYFDVPLNKVFEMEEETLSSRTILHHFRVLSVILQAAVYDEVILSNPCARVKPPKVEISEAHYLDDEQAEMLIKMVNEKAAHPFDVIIITLLHTGMRRGECCGLKWDDIDFEHCTIDINKALLYLPGEGAFEDETKTYSSKRVIKVGQDLIDLFKKYKHWQDSEAYKLGDKWIDSGYVFTAWNGKAINPGTVSAWFHKFIIENNLPYISIHGLRHTNASLMISNGIPITTTAKRLGHSTSATTSKVYAHAIKSADAMTAEIIQSLLPIK